MFFTINDLQHVQLLHCTSITLLTAKASGLSRKLPIQELLKLDHVFFNYQRESPLLKVYILLFRKKKTDTKNTVYTS